MPNDAPTWEDTEPLEPGTGATAVAEQPPSWEDTEPLEPGTGATAVAEQPPSWEDTEPITAPEESLTPNVRLNLSPQEKIQSALIQRGAGMEPMGPFGPINPAEGIEQLRAVPQTLVEGLGEITSIPKRIMRYHAEQFPTFEAPYSTTQQTKPARFGEHETDQERLDTLYNQPLYQPKNFLDPTDMDKILMGATTPDSLLTLPIGLSKTGAKVLLFSMIPGLANSVTRVVNSGSSPDEKRDAINQLVVPAVLGLMGSRPEGAGLPAVPEGLRGRLPESPVPAPLEFTGSAMPGLPKGALPRSLQGVVQYPEAIGPPTPLRGPAPVPETPAEIRETPEEIVRRSNARTRREIQKALTDAGLPRPSNEEAAAIRNRVWGKPGESERVGVTVSPTIPQPPPVPAGQVPPPVPTEPVPAPPAASAGTQPPPVPAGQVPPPAPAAPSAPPVARLGTGTTRLDEFGNPSGTTYHATQEDWNAWEALKRKIAAVQQDKTLSLKEKFAQLVALGAENERLKNKYGLMPPQPPKGESAPAPSAPPAAPVEPSPPSPPQPQAPSSASAPTPEPQYLGMPVSYWQNLIDNMPTGAARKRLARQLGVPNQRAKIVQHLRRRIAEAQTKPVKPPPPAPAGQVPPPVPTEPVPAPPVAPAGTQPPPVPAGQVPPPVPTEPVPAPPAAPAGTQPPPAPAGQVPLPVPVPAPPAAPAGTQPPPAPAGQVPLPVPVPAPPAASAGTQPPPVPAGQVPPPAPAAPSAPPVARLGTGTTRLDEFGNPSGTTYHATQEDWNAWEALKRKMAAVQQDKTLSPKEKLAQLIALGAENERLRNKYGGMTPQPPKGESAPAPSAPPAAPVEPSPPSPPQPQAPSSASAPTPEPQYLGMPVSYWQNLIDNMPTGAARERLARQLGVPNQPAKIVQHLRRRIAEAQTKPVKPPRITFAAYMPEGATKPEIGPHHPGILERLGVKGFETPESRNTPQFGFVDETGAFLTREQAAERAKQTGQDLKEFEKGELAHSDEIAAAPGGETPISEAPAPAAPEDMSVGPGAASPAEFGEAPDPEVVGLAIGSPAYARLKRGYQNIIEGFRQLWGRSDKKRDLMSLANATTNMPRMAGNQAGNSIRVRTEELQRTAITFVMQALKMSGQGLSADDAARLGALEHAGDPIGYLRTKQTDMETAAQAFAQKGQNLEAHAARDAANAMRYARTHFNQLRPLAEFVKRKLDLQLRREAAAGLQTDYENWYVPQRHELDLYTGADRPIVLGDSKGGAGGSASFRKAKVFEDYASAIEAGFVPRSLDIADLVEHRVTQGEQLIARKGFFDSLKAIGDPVDGNPIAMPVPRRVIKRPDGSIDVQESVPRGYTKQEVYPGYSVAVHDGYGRLIRALTGRSQLAESAAVGTLMNLAAVEKHLMLALDTFHASRTLQAELALTGKLSLGARQRLGRALVEYSPADLDAAVTKGEITQEMADYIRTPQEMQINGRTVKVSPANLLRYGVRQGLNAGRFADALYSDWLRNVPISGRVNKWVFDKMTRSAIAHSFLSEFERVAKARPDLTAQQVASNVTRDINVMFGNLLKESIFRNPSLRSIMQVLFLAPTWVEALARREGRAVLQAGQYAADVARGRPAHLGTAAKGVGTGLAAYVVATQLVNLITRHQLTFQNPEAGHKLDAWIPGGRHGFFVSPLSVFGEITHDILRYAEAKPDFATALQQIGANKLGNLGRFLGVITTGRDPLTGDKIIGTARRAITAGISLAPVPITVSAPLKEAGSFLGITSAPPPGGVQRQLLSSAGLKTEPAPTAQQQIYQIADKWKSQASPRLAAEVERRLKQDFGQSDYSSLRTALFRGDAQQAKAAYQQLRDQGKTPRTIKQTLQHPHPFTGSSVAERAFRRSLTPEQQDLYREAVKERQDLYRKFQEMLYTK